MMVLSKDKRGLSAVMGYVLVIVLVIVLSAFIFNWLMFISEDSSVVGVSADSGSVMSGVAECPEDIGVIIEDKSCATTMGNVRLNLTLKNQGLFDVDGYTVRVHNRSGADVGFYILNETGVPLNIGEEYLDVYNITEGGILGNVTWVEVQPFLKEGDKISCKSYVSKSVECLYDGCIPITHCAIIGTGGVPCGGPVNNSCGVYCGKTGTRCASGVCDGATCEADCDEDIVLMLHMDDDGLTDSLGEHTINVNGATRSSTAMSGFGSSAYFDGVDDYLSISDSDDWSFVDEPFTIDFWAYFDALPGSGYSNMFFSEWADASDSNKAMALALQNFGSEYGIRFSYSTDGVSENNLQFPWTPSVSTWYHLALVRDGNNVRVFVDGVQIGTTQTLSDSIYDSTRTVYIGTDHRAGSSPNLFNGYIDELRISKGVAKWSFEFNDDLPGEYTCCGDGICNGGEAPSSCSDDCSDTNVVLMLHMDDEGLTDSSFTPHDIVPNGGVSRSSAQSKSGGYSAYFDGVDDYLSIASSSEFYVDSDFTWDAWIYPEKYDSAIIGRYGSHTRGALWFEVDGTNNAHSNKLLFSVEYNPAYSVLMSSGVDVQLNTWSHVAISRQGDIWYLFLNGIIKNTYIQSSIINTNTPTTIGAYAVDHTNPDNYFKGYIDELRMTKGIARWTSDSDEKDCNYFVGPDTHGCANVGVGEVRYDGLSREACATYCESLDFTTCVMHNSGTCSCNDGTFVDYCTGCAPARYYTHHYFLHLYQERPQSY